MGALFTDVRHAVRALVRNPAFLLAGAGTLALGVAVNVPVFGLANALLFRPLPVQDGDRLTVFARERKDGGPAANFLVTEFEALRSSVKDWHGAVAVSGGMFGVSHDGVTDRVSVSFVSDNYWDALGLTPAVGQFFRPLARDTQLAEPVIVLSHDYWRDRFSADPGVVGKSVVLGGNTVVVVGVAPESFYGNSLFSEIKAFMPLAAPGFGADRRPVRVFAFLNRGISLKEANASLAGISAAFARQRRESPSDVRVTAFWERFARPDPSAAPAQMAGAAFFGILAMLVLGLACVNTANLVLIRLDGRSGEIAVRSALGAGGVRLVFSLFTETAIVVVIGAALGLSAGHAMMKGLAALLPSAYAPLLRQVTFDWRGAMFITGILVATAVAVAVLPAVRAVRLLSVGQRPSARTVTSGRTPVRTGLMVAQVACALMLLAVAGVFARTLSASRQPPYGFNPTNIFNVSMNPAEQGDGGRPAVERLKTILASVSSLPGIEAATLTQCVPLASARNSIATVYTDQQTAASDAGQSVEYVGYCSVVPGFFDTLKIQLEAGRTFLPTDAPSARRVAVISRSMAAKYWPRGNALGATFYVNSPGAPPVQVVGIAADIMNYSSTQDLRTPFFYLPLDQHPTPNVTLQVRSSLPAGVLAHNITSVVRATAPDIVPFNAQSFSSAIAEAPTGLLLPRLGSLLATAFGCLGLLLSIVGVYGVVAYGASQRTRELALRMALGATPADIRKTVLKTGTSVVFAGITIGVVLAVIGARFAAGVYPGVRVADPLTFAAAAGVVGIAAFAACYVPARRAMRVHPATVLRES